MQNVTYNGVRYRAPWVNSLFYPLIVAMPFFFVSFYNARTSQHAKYQNVLPWFSFDLNGFYCTRSTEGTKTAERIHEGTVQH